MVTIVPRSFGGARDLYLFDFPRAVPLLEYEVAVTRVTTWLAKQRGVVAVYQLGSVSVPGISDVDLLAVFDDDTHCAADPRVCLDDRTRYLFTHSVFAVARRQFAAAQAVTLMRGYRLLWGEELRQGGELDLAEEPEELRWQVAVEYLLSNYLARTVEATYGLLSVRNLLLWGNALRYDLQLLDMFDGELFGLVQELIAWRGRWFEIPVQRNEIVTWFAAVLRALDTTVNQLLADRKLALPVQGPTAYKRHIVLWPSDHLWITHRGVRLPTRLGFLRRRYFRLQHRLNRFDMGIPCERPRVGSIIERRFDFIRATRQDRQRSYPNFGTLTGGLSPSSA